MIISSHAQRRAATSAKSLISSSNVTNLSSSRLSAAEIAKSQWLRTSSSQLDGAVSVWTRAGLLSTEQSHPHSSQIFQHPSPQLTQKSPSASARLTHPLAARHFMLQCRHRRLSDSTIHRPDRRRYSTAAAVAESPSGIDNTSQSPNSSPRNRLTNLSQPLGGNNYLQLVLPNEQQGPASESYASLQFKTEEIQPSQGRVLRLNGTIDPVKALTAALKVDRKFGNQQTGLAEYLVTHDTQDLFSVGWEDIMKKLKTRTPVQHPNNEVATIKGNEDEIFELYYLLNLNPLYELVVGFPIIQLGIGRMTIQGSKHGFQSALDYIESEEIDVVAKRGMSHTTPGVARRVRSVAPARRISDVPRPTSWTRRALAQYVDALITTRPPVVRRGTAQSQEAAKEEALSIIMNLLQAPEVRPFLSWTVFQKVMSFIMKQRKTNEAWSLMALMKALRFHPYAPFYNPMLLASAQDQLLDSFEGVLDTMHGQRVRPDAGTWMALLVGNMTLEFKQEVMRSMADRGLSARSAFDGELAPVMIPFSLPNFLSTGGNITDYIDILDDIWGPSWLSDSAVRQMVDVIASRGDIIGAVRLVNHLKNTRDYEPTKSPLHAMLKHCKRTKSVDLGVWLVAYASEHWMVAAQDHIIFEWSFQMAWDAKMFNLLRVVWTYVTCAGQATHKMRNNIKQSLDDRLEAEDRSVALRWKSAAGCVACNADPLLDHRMTAEIIAADLGRFEKVVPRKSFVTMLIEALLMDKEWIEDMSKLTKGTTWKRLNAIRVELMQADPKVRRTISSKPVVTPKSVRLASYDARRRMNLVRRAKQAKQGHRMVIPSK